MVLMVRRFLLNVYRYNVGKYKFTFRLGLSWSELKSIDRRFDVRFLTEIVTQGNELTKEEQLTN